MNFINHLIMLIDDKGLRLTVYNLVFIATFFLVLIFTMWYRKKYSISLPCLAGILIVLYPLGYSWLFLRVWIEHGFKSIPGVNAIHGYVYYPLFLIPVARLFKTNINKITDFVAPVLALQQGVLRHACVFTGCCHGHYAPWGIWNPVVKDYVFPSQWVESGVAFLICAYLFREGKKQAYAGNGELYPVFLIYYGSTWFLLQYLRNDDKLIGNLSDLAVHGIFMVMVGIVWLLCITRLNSKNKTLNV